MSPSLSDIVDLNLAWKRVKQDLDGRVFLKIPFEFELIEMNLEPWLEGLRKSLADNHYHPSPAVICDVPKPRGAIRPAAYLQIRDRVVYAACVGACYQHIYQSVYWAPEISDFSNPLAFNFREPQWIRSSFRLWKDFRNKSLEVINSGAAYVVIADISAYFENIDIATLSSDLKQIGSPVEAANQISACLNRWAHTQGRGIPQGNSTSDILGKLYLTAVDKHLRALGHTHYRYVDDIRIFCESKREARRALLDLIAILRTRGLNIQTAKTGIYTADEARLEIEGVQPIIIHTLNRYIEKVREILWDDPYITMIDAETLLSRSTDNTPIEIIREVFKTYFLEGGQKKFDKTLFRFLLKRLGKQGDRYALSYCLTLLEAQPEETHTVLSYFKVINAISDVEIDIVRFLNSVDAVYSFQIYQLIEWCSTLDFTPREQLVIAVRRLTFDYAQPFYVHSVGRYFLGKFGSANDLEALESAYPRSSPNEQVEIICALQRMEKGRRNAFLARAEHDGELHGRAAKFVRGKSSNNP